MATYRLQGESGGAPLDIPLVSASLRLTRAAGGDLELGADEVGLPDVGVSTPHATIHQDHGAWFVTDLSTSGGTWVGAQRVTAGQPALLAPGVTIRLGQFTSLRVVAPEVHTADGTTVDPSAPVFALPDGPGGTPLGPPRPAAPARFGQALAVLLAALAVLAVGAAAYFVWSTMGR